MYNGWVCVLYTLLCSRADLLTTELNLELERKNKKNFRVDSIVLIYLYIKEKMEDLKKFIATTIRECLNENEDNYSSFKGMEPYHQRKQDFINSIKSFKDIDDNKIREIFDFLGTEGYNDEEDAFEDFKDKIQEWRNFSNPVKLYRVVGVKK